MNKNYAVFPCENINITQNYNGQDQNGGINGSHVTQSSSTNGIKSYPIDICYGDTYFMAPCRMRSVDMTYFNDDTTTNIVNQVWFQSTEKVNLVNGEYEYITILVTHPDDWDYDRSKIGTIYERGDNAVNQGTDGGVAAHLDIVVGVGLHDADWVKNSFNEGVLPNSRKPEEVFYIDPNYNHPINTCGINFQPIPSDAYTTLPTPVARDLTKEQVQVICGENTLFVRTGAGTLNSSIGYATPGIYNVISTIEADGYTWYQVEEGKWFANVDGCTQELHIASPIIPIISEEESYDNLPIGTQIAFSGSTIPKSYLICNGSEISREEYSDLFTVIGTMYGEGDGTTTFNIPNKKGKVSVGFNDVETEFNTIGKTAGAKTHTLTNEQLPPMVIVRDSLSDGGYGNQNWGGPYSGWGNYQNNSRGYVTNQAHNNLQPYEVDVWLIKAKKTIDSIIVEGNVIDGFGSLSTSDASSIRNATELNNKFVIDHITIGLSSNVTWTGTASWVPLSYNTTLVSSGEKLMRSANSIIIGKNVKKVRVYSNLTFDCSSEQPNNYIFSSIFKNNVLQCSAISALSRWGTIPNNITIDVVEGDVITTRVWSGYTGDILFSPYITTFGSKCNYLNVEVIE